MAHFVDGVQNDKTPLVTGEDARVVLEVLFAAYESARAQGGIPVSLDRQPTDRSVALRWHGRFRGARGSRAPVGQW